RGRRAGQRVTVLADCHAGPRAGWGIGPDIDTGAPPSIAAQMLISGEIEPRPGVWAPEEIVPLEPFFRELRRRGMVVRRTRRQGREAAGRPREVLDRVQDLPERLRLPGPERASAAPPEPDDGREVAHEPLGSPHELARLGRPVVLGPPPVDRPHPSSPPSH